MVGVLNSIRFVGERRGQCSNVDYSREVQSFNKFSGETGLVDIPLVSRKFTWYKPNDTVKSRIYRIVVPPDWLVKWSGCKQYALSRSVSDHCALILKVTSIDWGTKPFRSFDIWQKDGRFRDFIKCQWNNYEILGSGLFVMKEKLERLKSDIKKWNRDVLEM